jgi:hypothetical protein
MWKETYFKILFQYLPEGTEEIHENYRNNRPPSRDTNSVYPGYNPCADHYVTMPIWSPKAGPWYVCRSIYIYLCAKLCCFYAVLPSGYHTPSLPVFSPTSSSSFPIQGLGHWPVPAFMNPTFCVIYQDLFFLWACTKEPTSALVLLPSFPRVQADLVCIFLFCHSLKTLLILSSFLILSRLVHPFTDLTNRISAACSFHVSFPRCPTFASIQQCRNSHYLVEFYLCILPSFFLNCSPNSATYILEFFNLTAANSKHYMHLGLSGFTHRNRVDGVNSMVHTKPWFVSLLGTDRRE